MKVLIIGGAGFIGANAAHFYARRGDDVTILDNFSRPGSRVNAAWLAETYRTIKIVHGDIRSDHAALQAQMKSTDLILHEAGQVAVTTSVLDPRTDFEINALGTLNVLEALRHSGSDAALFFASTNKVYGGLEHLDVIERNGRYEFAGDAGVNESETLDFHSPYGCSKGCAEQYVRDYARIYGLKTVVFRQSCIYGPHQFGVEDQGWVAWFSIRASQSQPITVYGDGKQVRDVLYVDDLVAAYDAAYEHIDVTSGQIYNLGGGPQNAMSLLELIALLEKRYRRPLKVAFSSWRPGDQRVFIAGIDKANRDFGWKPTTSIPDGVDTMCAWIDENPELFAELALVGT